MIKRTISLSALICLFLVPALFAINATNYCTWLSEVQSKLPPTQEKSENLEASCIKTLYVYKVNYVYKENVEYLNSVIYSLYARISELEAQLGLNKPTESTYETKDGKTVTAAIPIVQLHTYQDGIPKDESEDDNNTDK